MRRYVREGILVRVRRGVLVGRCRVERAAGDPVYAHLLGVRALRCSFGDCVASDESAALLHRLPLLTVPPDARLSRPAGAWRGGDLGRVRVVPLPAHHLDTIDGIPCTSLSRTVIDIARHLPFRDAVVAGDAALRLGCSTTDLGAMLAECADWADLGPTRRAVAFFDPLAESPFESVSRAVMHERAVPPPEVQVRLLGASGREYRVDFYWRRWRLIGEADGRAKYSLNPGEDPETVAWREKLREDDLRDEGHGFVRWTYGQMLGETDHTIARIMRRLQA